MSDLHHKGDKFINLYYIKDDIKGHNAEIKSGLNTVSRFNCQ